VRYIIVVIEHVKLYFPTASDTSKPFLELHVGADAVSKIFFDKENPNTLVVLTEEGIATYTGFLVVCIKGYKAKE